MDNENYNDFSEQGQEPKIRPRMLLVLCVLSLVYILSTSVAIISSISNGPLSDSEVEAQVAEYYSTINKLEEDGNEIPDSMKEMVDKMVANAKYTNQEVFYVNSYLNLFTLLVGLVGVVLMYNLKKIGFHIYIIYSLLPIVAMYFIIPFELIPTLTVMVSLVTSTLFVILYSLNLKSME